jgi:hypothetical protein
VAQHKKPEFLSISQLLGRIEAEGGWTLVLAQRSFEWDDNRICNLVDSLLEGFPIGSLLVVDGKDKAQGYAMDGSRHGGRQTVQGTAQVLDGQQRCLSIQAAFSDTGLDPETDKARQLWIHVGAENSHRRPFHPKQGRRVRLHWTNRKAVNELTAKERRVERLPSHTPTTGWLRFHELVGRRAQRPSVIAKAAGIALDEVSRKHILALCARLRDLMSVPFIPVHHWRPTKSPAQMERLHHAFVRLNTGGVQLGGEDQFLAGVKLYWPEAEDRLATIGQGSQDLLDQRGALELLARISIRSLSEGRSDSTPLTLSDLARYGSADSKNECVQQMRDLSGSKTDAARLRRSIDKVCSMLVDRLGGAAAHIGRSQLLASIAWVYRREEGRLKVRDSELSDLLGFMFWTTAFSCHSYGKARFARAMMHSAWKEGGGRNPGPRPLARDTVDFRQVCYDHRFIRPLFWEASTDGLSAEDGLYPGPKTELILRNRGLFGLLFQGIGMGADVEWDHILPFSQAKRMFKEGRSQVWEYASWMNQSGNLAAIDGRANRILGDRGLATKLAWDGADSKESYANRSFIKHKSCISVVEMRLLRAVAAGAKAKNMQAAGPAFRAFVLHRTARIWARAEAVAGPAPVLPPKRRPGTRSD